MTQLGQFSTQLGQFSTNLGQFPTSLGPFLTNSDQILTIFNKISYFSAHLVIFPLMWQIFQLFANFQPVYTFLNHLTVFCVIGFILAYVALFPNEKLPHKIFKFREKLIYLRTIFIIK